MKGILMLFVCFSLVLLCGPMLGQDLAPLPGEAVILTPSTVVVSPPVVVQERIIGPITPPMVYLPQTYTVVRTTDYYRVKAVPWRYQRRYVIYR